VKASQLTTMGLAGCVLGALLMIASVVWPRLVRTGATWTDGQAVAYANAAGTYHKLAFEHGGTPESESNLGEHPDVTAARQRYQLLRDDFDRARAAGQTGARILRWSGIACGLFGGALLVIQRAQRNTR
jgi:hypothetical protein